MIFRYIFVALLSATGSVALMWPHGVLEAILAAPIGGSFGAMVAAGWVLSRNSARSSSLQPKRKVAAHFAPTWTAAAHA